MIPEKKNIHVMNPEQITEPTNEVQVRGFQLKKSPMPAVTAPAGGGTVDAQSRAAINSIIANLVALGLFKQN